jgi:hypothetical protein
VTRAFFTKTLFYFIFHGLKFFFFLNSTFHNFSLLINHRKYFSLYFILADVHEVNFPSKCNICTITYEFLCTFMFSVRVSTPTKALDEKKPKCSFSIPSHRKKNIFKCSSGVDDERHPTAFQCFSQLGDKEDFLIHFFFVVSEKRRCKKRETQQNNNKKKFFFPKNKTTTAKQSEGGENNKNFSFFSLVEKTRKILCRAVVFYCLQQQNEDGEKIKSTTQQGKG